MRYRGTISAGVEVVDAEGAQEKRKDDVDGSIFWMGLRGCIVDVTDRYGAGLVTIYL